MLSSPNYVLNWFGGEIPIKTWNKLINNKNKPFNNRAIQSSYPPGSIFKLILASIVLDKNIISKDWKINCNGKYEFYDKTFRCWKEDGHGTVDLNDAIKKSCNIYFYNLIQKIDFSHVFFNVIKLALSLVILSNKYRITRWISRNWWFRISCCFLSNTLINKL